MHNALLLAISIGVISFYWKICRKYVAGKKVNELRRGCAEADVFAAAALHTASQSYYTVWRLIQLTYCVYVHVT